MKWILNWFRTYFGMNPEPVQNHVKMRYDIPLFHNDGRWYVTKEDMDKIRDRVLSYDFSEFKDGAYCCMRCRMMQYKNMKYKHSREECNFKLVELITNS